MADATAVCIYRVSTALANIVSLAFIVNFISYFGSHVTT